MNWKFKVKIYTIFFLLAALAAAAVYFVSAGYYPVASVNGRFITARTFGENYRATSNYYKNLLEAYNSNNSSSSPAIAGSESGISSDELRRSVLTGLVENILVENGARVEAGDDFDKIISEKVERAAAVPGIEKNAKALYGLNIGKFKRYVLAPQAERDMLAGALFLGGRKFDDWLAAEKKAAKIVILSGEFYWDGQNVAVK